MLLSLTCKVLQWGKKVLVSVSVTLALQSYIMFSPVGYNTLVRLLVFLSVCVCFSSFFCCLTSRTSFPVIKAKGCLATSLVLIVRGDVSPLTGSPACLSLTLCRQCNVYGRCLLCVHDCSCISVEHCAFAPANIAQEDGKRTQGGSGSVDSFFVLLLFFFLKQKRTNQLCHCMFRNPPCYTFMCDLVTSAD